MYHGDCVSTENCDTPGKSNESFELVVKTNDILSRGKIYTKNIKQISTTFLCIDCDGTVQDTSRERGRIPGEYFDLLHSLLFYTCTYGRWQTQCVA